MLQGQESIWVSLISGDIDQVLWELWQHPKASLTPISSPLPLNFSNFIIFKVTSFMCLILVYLIFCSINL